MRIKLLGLLFFSCLLLTSHTLQAQESLRFTLDQALAIALSESNAVKIADMTVEKTGYARKGSYAALFPNINANDSYHRTLLNQVMVLEMFGQVQEIQVGTSNNMNAGVSASMPLVNAQLWESLKLSALNVEMAVEQARSSKIAMVAQVKQAFYGVLLASESLNLMQQVYDNAVNNYGETIKKFNVGKASEVEKLRAQVTVMNAEPKVTSAQNAVLLAKWRLKALMGIDLETELDVLGTLNDYTNELLTPFLINNDLDNNSTLQQLRIQSRQLDASIRVLKFQYIPTLSASISYNYMAMSNSFDMKWKPYSVAGLSLNFPIFDGFSKHNSIRQSKITRNMLDLQIEDTQRNLQIAMKNYNDQIALNIKNYTAAKSAVEMAQKSYDISAKMYEIGKTTLIELNDAQLALTQAQLNMNQAIYNYMVAKASLDELVGKDYPNKQ